MMNIRKTALVAALGATIVFTTQCNHRDDLAKNGRESKTGGRSHNFGLNCMKCHNDANNEASGEWWNIAGSVLQSDLSGHATTGYVELWSGPDRTGTKYATLEIDGSGNFYTEKIIDYKGACYPAVVSTNGHYSYMSQAFTGGGCNSCHDDNTASRLALSE
jgi:hypothetical protein